MKYILWCEDPYILAPLLGNLILEKEKNTIIYTSNLAYKLLKLENKFSKNIEVVNIATLKINKIQLLIHKLLLWFLESPDLSYLWRQERKKKFKYPKNNIISKAINLFFTQKKRREIYRLFTSFIPGFHIEHDEIYIYSVCNFPFLFSKNNCKINLIFDSWDHIFKSPLLFYPTKIFCWNDSITEIIKKTHSIKNVSSINTYRFEYINRYLKNNENLSDRENTFKKEKWIYFFSYSLFDSRKRFYYELDLIKKISYELTKRDIKVMIKLKPYHLKEEEEEISKYEHLSIIKNDFSIRDYFYENKLIERCDILSSSNLLISIGSTILLEGAMLKIPILPLFNKYSKNTVLSDISKNDHLNSFLLPLINENHLLSKDRDPIEIINKNNIEEIRTACELLSKELRKWYYKNKIKNLPYFKKLN